ncbi:MAG: hypothetical protein COA50_12080 [Flavobacteriaceae bacterium]|nr:MAG: hypothetical protein COA50_12080 [Flavobacteriaceae bacterium]
MKINWLRRRRLLFIGGLLLLYNLQLVAQSIEEKPRTIVTTDGEIDDVDSFIRMLLYANEFKIEGLIYSSSMWHYKGDGKGTTMVSEMEMTRKIYGEQTDLRWPGTQWMQELIAAYDEVYPILSTHAEGFPTADYLKSLVKIGNIDFEGEMDKDTEGSNFIKNKLLDDDMSPLYLQVWGGTNTIARALKVIEKEYKNTDQWSEIYSKVCKKAIIYAILDQDATYRKYISTNWPDVKIYYNSNQFWCFAYPWKSAVSEELHPYLEGEFMGRNIINNHGPLLKMYYSYGDGQKQEGDDEHIHGDLSKLKETQWGTFKKYDFISEGDSPAFLHLVDIGLDNLNNPHYGGWGGRLQQSKTNLNRWEDGEEVADFNPISQKMDLAYPQIRWLKTLQLDFASRADWCIKNYENANHAPIIQLDQSNVVQVKPGQKVKLRANATDPDGDKLGYSWWQYEEVDTYAGKVKVLHPNKSKTSLLVPNDIKKGETIHMIIEVTDSGTPSLTRYQRVVLETN